MPKLQSVGRHGGLYQSKYPGIDTVSGLVHVHVHVQTSQFRLFSGVWQFKVTGFEGGLNYIALAGQSWID